MESRVIRPHCFIAALAVLAGGCDTDGLPGSSPLEPEHASSPLAADLTLNGTLVSLGFNRFDTCPSEELRRGGAPSPYGCEINGPLLSGPLAAVALSPVT